TGNPRVRARHSGALLAHREGVELYCAWWPVTHALQMTRDSPDSADEERAVPRDVAAPGPKPQLAFDPAEDVAAPCINTGARQRVASLREQGVNSHIEMARAFGRAGFAPVDVHMSDLVAGRIALGGFKGVAACGGFSYGDVLGAGRGWATSILERPELRAAF